MDDVPSWNYDGSSTYQVTTSNSEVILKPVAVYRDPFRKGNAANMPLSEKRTLVALTKISENKEVLNYCRVDHFRIGDSVELRNLFSGDEDWLKADVVDIGSDSFLHAVHFSVKYGDMLVLDSNYLGDIVRGNHMEMSSYINFQLVHQIMEAKKNEALKPREWRRTFGGGLKLMTAPEIWEQGLGILACC